MNKISIALSTLLFVKTSLLALTDDNNLKLLEPEKLLQVEGKEDEALKPIVKIVSEDSLKVPELEVKENKNDIAGLDVSSYRQVKLIDAVLETLSHSDLLKSSRENVIQYELKVKTALADYYPTLDFEYKTQRTRSYPSGEDGVKFKYFNDRTYKLALKQNLYSGGSTGHNVSSVVKRLDVAKNQYKIALDDEIKKAINAYFDVVFTYRSVMVNERNMDKLNKILQIVTVKYDNGAASIGDLTSIKANVANSLTKLVKVKSKFIEALKYYEYIVGIDFEKTLPFEKNFDVNIGDFDEIYERALEKNKELINYTETIEVEKFNQKVAQSSFRPTVDFELNYEKTMDADALEVHEADVVGKVTLKYNILNGGKDKNNVLEVSSKIRALKYKLSEEKKKLKWNLSKVHTSITSVSDALKSTITEIIASRKMVSAYWDAFKLGEQDLNTLLQGQRQLNSAETDLVDYEKSHVSDFFNILELTGDLATFFDVDPENPKFIDFSKSDYQKTIYAKDGEELTLDTNKKQKIKEDILKEQKEEKPKDIPLPKASIDENINKFLEEFKEFDDESFMIEISSFTNIFNSFNFIRENNLDKNSFSYDVLDNLNIISKVAHNNFKDLAKAEEYLKSLEEKEFEKEYNIKKVKEIKALYENYENGLKVEKPKPEIKIKTKIKVVEKLRQAVKKENFVTNEEFKEKFLAANPEYFTINVSSFTNIDDIQEFIEKNDIYNESFFFKYGNDGQLIKLVNGVFENYVTLQDTLKKLSSSNKTIFPVVEKIASVKKQYEDNIELNKIKDEEPVQYEYIDISKEKKNYPLKLEKTEEETQEIREEIKEIEKEELIEKKEEVLEEKEQLINKIQKEVKALKENQVTQLEQKILEEKEEQIVEENTVEDFEKEFLKAPRDYYTINVASLDSMEEAQGFIKLHRIKDNSIKVISNSGKIMVMYGIYENREDALKAKESLPNSIKLNNPLLHKIYRTQESYRKNNLKEIINDTSKSNLENEEKIDNSIDKNYTIKLTTIESDKIDRFIKRYSFDKNYVKSIKKGEKSELYYGEFETITEAKTQIENFHPIIYAINPPIVKIGALK